MQIVMKSGRKVTNPYAKDVKFESVATADGQEVAIAGVDNAREGICPKCRGAMGTAYIPQGQVYYCEDCRVTTPIPEGV